MTDGAVDEELEMLAAIYADELSVTTTGGFKRELHITCTPRTAGDSAYCSAQLRIQLLPGYPSEQPLYRITQTSCLNDENSRELQHRMQQLLAELYTEERWEGCCYQLIDCVTEALSDMNTQAECAICFASSGDDVVRTVCFHIFCSNCLANWWRQHEAAQQLSRREEGCLRRRALAGDCDAKRAAVAAATTEVERLQIELDAAEQAHAELDAAAALETASADEKATLRQAKGQVVALQAALNKQTTALPKLKIALQDAEVALAQATAQQAKVCRAVT